jgi:hypothetical protein
MKIILWQDETVSLDLVSLAENLNRFFSGLLTYEASNTPVKIPGHFITNPDTYTSLLKLNSFKAAVKTADRVFVITKKPYDNNFFWDSPPGALSIFSCFGWEDLTSLPLSNGFVYVAAWFVANQIELRLPNRHDKITGCINDFLWDKTGIDVCMRSAFVCPECLKLFQKQKLTSRQQQLFDGLSKLLNDLSTASRANNDILSFWRFRPSDPDFDVFLCHNSQEKSSIRKISDQLKEKGIRPWLDEEQIQPGRAWQDVLEATIPKIKTAAVFVGNIGFGPWQNVEIRAFLQEFVRRQCPVIPVMLADATTAPELPLFMRQFMWVDFRKTHPDPFKQLIWGITGLRDC